MAAIALVTAAPAAAVWPTPVPPRPTPTAAPPTPTPRPTATATPRPTVAATATPRPAVTATPTPATGLQTPLLRLRVAPIRLARPAVGEPIRCSAALLLAGCTPGDPLVIPIWFTDSADEAPADFQLVRVR